jgi:hypothetical protein
MTSTERFILQEAIENLSRILHRSKLDKVRPSLEELDNIFQRYFHINKNLLRSRRRTQSTCSKRFIFMYMANIDMRYNYTEIGLYLKKDHSTVRTLLGRRLMSKEEIIDYHRIKKMAPELFSPDLSLAPVETEQASYQQLPLHLSVEETPKTL